MKKLAVVILNYKSAEKCKTCVSQLKMQVAVELTIIVVDNSSDDNDYSILEEFCSAEDVVLLRSKANLGYSAGNNIGLKYAIEKMGGYGFVAIANPDMAFPEADCLSKCMNAMEQDESIAVLGPDILLPDGSHQNPQKHNPVFFWSTFFKPFHLLMDMILRRKRFEYISLDWNESRYCHKVVGSFLLIRSDFLKRIGYLDEGTFLYWEEAILAEQVRAEGMKTYYFSEAHALHTHDFSVVQNPCKAIRHYQKSQLYYLRKYCGFSKLQFFAVFLSKSFGNALQNLFLWMKYHQN